MPNTGFHLVCWISLKILIYCCLQAEACYSDSYEGCTYLKQNEASQHFGGRCFCYSSGSALKWKDYWSTFQVHLTSADDARIVFPFEGSTCHNPEKHSVKLGCFMARFWPLSSQGDTSLEVPLVDRDVCFTLKTHVNARYTLRVTAKQTSRLYLGLCVCGVILFLMAGAICRSSLFFYATGMSLGMVSPPVFMLFTLKNFISKRLVFLMLFCTSCSLTYQSLGWLLTRWEETISVYWKEVLGYLLVSGLISLAVCYKHGPITDRYTLMLITSVLQAAGLGLVFYGITYPPAAYTVMGFLLVVKLLPFSVSVLWGICRRLLGSFVRRGPPRVRLLTEEEYRDQGEVYTKSSLEELRQHCNKPDFPAWETVLRLRSPQRFAQFLRDGSHVSAEESQGHDHQYGLGGAFYEDTIFSWCNGVRRASSQLRDGDDISDNGSDGGECASPPLSPAPALSPPSSPLALLPPPSNLPVCPYPTASYSPPYPEPMDMEDPF